MSLSYDRGTILIFDLEVTGHHPGYIRYLLRHLPDAGSMVVLVVSPALMKEHQDLVQTESRANITWQPITQGEMEWYRRSKKSRIRRAWVEWRLYCRYAQRVQAVQGLVMFVDCFQLPLALRLFLPCPTLGILFRPKFHYDQFNQGKLTHKGRLTALREQWLWRGALGHSKLKVLFCLDPLAVEPLRALGGKTTVSHLPDPIEFSAPSAEVISTLRRKLEIGLERKIFLLFGILDKRKGVYQLLDALKVLSPIEQMQLTILLVGSLAAEDSEAINREISDLNRATSVQIVLHDCYVPEEEIPCYFALTDVVLAIYQRHVGSSGILLWAAAAGKPVLASDYGLMGVQVKRHQLGQALDSSRPDEIASAIKNHLVGKEFKRFNKDVAAKFARSNSPQHFAEAIWNQL